MATNIKPDTVKQPTVKFTKSALLKSKQFAGRTDLLRVLLKDGESYSIEQVHTLIKSFLSKEVK